MKLRSIFRRHRKCRKQIDNQDSPVDQYYRQSEPEQSCSCPDLPNLRLLIERESWKKVLEVLNSEAITCITKHSPEVSEIDDPLLHFACMYQPPLQIVVRIIEALPNSIKEMNHIGQYPLHSATQWGASPEVIKYFLDIYPESLHHQDHEGRTPLMLACKYYGTNCEITEKEARSEERRVGKECSFRCRSRWSPYH